MNTAELHRAAVGRLREYINRSAGQHRRAMRKQRPQDSYIDGVDAYDPAESQAEQAANEQIEHDQKVSQHL